MKAVERLHNGEAKQNPAKGMICELKRNEVLGIPKETKKVKK